ncbi:hypothetical protein E2C01_034657 [Portunus trituberculatus]|uniref:Uncharacterized protein n=1 Tax=Portunus trituberculatus TaxID=210409 RepID=A0A5B7F6X6_PORTR|nr:hypothetical protein [Portunus trituberculatus]
MQGSTDTPGPHNTLAHILQHSTLSPQLFFKAIEVISQVFKVYSQKGLFTKAREMISQVFMGVLATGDAENMSKHQ